MEKLEYELNKLEVEGFDLTLTGFSLEEIEMMKDEEMDLEEFISDEKKEKKIKLCPHCGEEI